MEPQLDLRLVKYRGLVLQNVVLNAGGLRDQLYAKNVSAFDNVANGCWDLEQIIPGKGKELKRKALEQKARYLMTYNPDCFTKLINDLEELYAQAFKLMLANFRKEKEEEIKRLDRENRRLRGLD